MDAANKEVDPADEEAKGGSGEVRGAPQRFFSNAVVCFPFVPSGLPDPGSVAAPSTSALATYLPAAVARHRSPCLRATPALRVPPIHYPCTLPKVPKGTSLILPGRPRGLARSVIWLCLCVCVSVFMVS